MLEVIMKRLRLNKRGVSSVIVVMLSLVLLVTVVANVVLWSYQMSQLDWERIREDVAIADVRPVGGNWSWNPSGYALGGSTTWLSGGASDLSLDDGAYVTFRSYYSGTHVTTFVDNDNSDVDASADKGMHSDFPAQQAGPDSSFDTLAEQDTNKILYQQASVSSERSTTNTAWTDVSGANVSFTPSSSAEEWMIIVTADIRSSSTSENMARFRYSINGIARGETGVQQGTTSTSPIDPYNVYFHFSRLTGVMSQQTVRFQFQASSGVTAYTRNIHIVCIRLDSAGLKYTEVNGDTLITGAQTLATLQFTPPVSGQYIVTYCTLVSESPIDPGGAETWLDHDFGTGLYPAAWTTPNTRRIHSDRDQYEPHGLFTRINLTASQHTFRVQTRLRTAGETSTARDVRIAAFRVDAFDLLEYDEDIAVSSTTAANTVRSVVNTQNPGEQRDYLILAGIQTISSGTTSRETGGIEIDDNFVQRKGDQRLSLTDIARIAPQYALVKTSSVNFKVETTYGTSGAGSDTIYSKQSVIYILKIPKKFELDLEAQWTTATHNLNHEELCVFGGSMGLENLQVDAWNGSAWHNLIADLSGGWNNVSVSAYLKSPTFTIRFRGGSETSDTTQDSWQTDATLLHTWSDSYTSEVEFTGSSNTEDWHQLNQTVDCAWTIGAVNVTLQLYNYTLGDYPVSGSGYLAYISDNTPNTEENKSQIITTGLTDFRNVTGYWKIRIRGTKADNTQFDFKADWVEFKAAKRAGALFTFKNAGSLTSHIVAVWVNNATHHHRYEKNVFINSGDTTSYVWSDINLPSKPYNIKIVTERGNTAIFSSQ